MVGRTEPALPSVVLQYERLEQITHDIDARVYGGIHFRFDQVAGARQGARVGRFIVSHNLQPVWGRDDTQGDGSTKTTTRPTSVTCQPTTQALVAWLCYFNVSR